MEPMTKPKPGSTELVSDGPTTAPLPPHWPPPPVPTIQGRIPLASRRCLMSLHSEQSAWTQGSTFWCWAASPDLPTPSTCPINSRYFSQATKTQEEARRQVHAAGSQGFKTPGSDVVWTDPRSVCILTQFAQTSCHDFDFSDFEFGDTSFGVFFNVTLLVCKHETAN